MKVLSVSTTSFDQEVIKSDVPVVVDFWAPWCGPCRAMGPVVDTLAEEYSGKVKVCKVNVDEEPTLAAQYRVMSIPTIILLKNGEVASSVIGSVTKDALIARLGL